MCQSQSNYGDVIVPSFTSEAGNSLYTYTYGTQFSWTIGNRAAQLPTESHYCDFGGCKKSFKRKGDLTKHKKKHNLPEHHCPHDLCSRAFPKGFHLKDKLVDHLVAKHKHMKEEAKRLVKISVRPSYDSLAEDHCLFSARLGSLHWLNYGQTEIGTTQSCG